MDPNKIEGITAWFNREIESSSVGNDIKKIAVKEMPGINLNRRYCLPPL
jgi:hypothetical protein